MNTIQLHQITPEELTNLIKEGIKPELQELLKRQQENTPQGKEFISRKETAEFLGISLVTLHDWMNKKIVMPYKMGNKTYFKYSELVETLLSSNRRA